MRIPESELIINADGSVFHLHIRPEQLADRIVLVGDPGRIPIMKAFFDNVECSGASREFVWITGLCKGTRITALSTGIGSDNIDIVMTELDALANVDFETREEKTLHKSLKIVRLGTCGAIQPEVPLGSYILSHYSIGFDGLLNWYSGKEKVTDSLMEKEFMKHMSWPSFLPVPYFVKASQKLIEAFEGGTVRGMTVCAPGFYGPQGRNVRMAPVIPDIIEKAESFRYDDWKIINFEMEGAAIAGMAKLLGHEAVTVCLAIAHRYLKNADTDYKKNMSDIAEYVLNTLAEIQ